MRTFDPGPPARLARHFAAVPDHSAWSDRFWLDWGPIFYRGRLDGKARVLCVGSDPGATERIAGRTLVGDAGQRVQGFLRKVGLVSSYACLNAFPFALYPSRASLAPQMLTDPAHRQWRNKLYDLATGPSLQAVVAFGEVAQEAVRMWSAPAQVFEVPHPSSHDETKLLKEWREAVTVLRGIVTRDADGSQAGTNYGQTFDESDYAPIPREDLPFGAPTFLGDDSWGRAQQPRRRTSVSRPSPDDRHTLIWKAPAP